MTALKYSDFYAEFADSYDLMTKDGNRWKRVQEIYLNMFEDELPESILDAGCGSGGEMIALSQHGINCIGVDGSAEMIRSARKKAEKAGSDTEFHVDDLTRLDKIETGFVDAVVCKGNTLPHIRTSENLNQAFSTFKRVTKKNGNLILQWLNYDRILSSKQRLIGVSGDNKEVFTRFYDFISSDELIFNILILKYEEKWKSRWISTPLTPWTSDVVVEALNRNGWKDCEIFGDLNKSDFIPDASSDIVVLAKSE